MEISPANSTPARIASWKSGAVAKRAASLKSAASPSFTAPLPLALWHLTSLDAPTVAVVWALAFAWTARISLPLWLPLLLALVAWAVYIADRLLDARSAHQTHRLHRIRLRHHFHWRHRQIFFPIAVASTCAATILVFTFMPIGALQPNTVLAAAALAYFSGVHIPRRLIPFPRRNISATSLKEPIVAILFTAACVLPTLSRTPHQSALELWPLTIPAFFFTLLAWLNCHAIEHWESAGGPSYPTVFVHAVSLAVIGQLLSFALTAFRPRSAALIAAGAASAFFLALLDRQRTRLTPLTLRATADLVLLTPVLLALLPQ